MRDYIIRRLLLVPPIMLGVSFATFAIFRIIPGDAAVMICQFQCTPETLRDIRHELGLDRPWYEQYGDWLWDISEPTLHDSVFGIDLHGLKVPGPKMDLGRSFFTKVKVADDLKHNLPVTLEIMILGLLFALLLGVPPGVISAMRTNTPLDWLARFFSVVWLSVPSFYLGMMFITFAFLWFGWTPPQFGRGYVPFTDDPWTNLQEFVPPALVLAMGIAAVIMRLTRSSMLEVMRNDYIRTAWSKGLRERTVIVRHALKNALIPVTTFVGLQVGALIGGSVIIESVFGLQGVGRYVLEAIIQRDLMVVQSVVLLFATAYVLVNLAVDLAYAWLDPRIHYA